MTLLVMNPSRHRYDPPRRRLLRFLLAIAFVTTILHSLFVSGGGGGLDSAVILDPVTRREGAVGLNLNQIGDGKPRKAESKAVTENLSDAAQPPPVPSESAVQDQEVSPAGSNVRRSVFSPRAFKHRQHDKLTILHNYVIPELLNDPNADPDDGNIVTYTTHGEVGFIGHLPFLAARWAAPISMGLYVPGSDFDLAVKCIAHVRWCHPEVKRWVTFHLVFPEGSFPSGRVPSPGDMAKILREAETWIDCAKKPWEDVVTYREKQWRKVIEKKITKPDKDDGTSAPEIPRPGTKAWQAVEMNTAPPMLYPINVIRNAAREAATTPYVLASDVELYPSANFAKEFAEMIKNAKPDEFGKKVVFPMPIFEVKANCAVPETKAQLLALFKKGDAIPFHAYVCPVCHHFPLREEWMSATNNASSPTAMSILGYSTRTGPSRIWEPIYVGTNAEPPYDERLSWEGKKDKMTQMYMLCLMNYKFAVLSNAFLVHSPGIKVYKQVPWRDGVASKQATFVRDVIRPELISLYGESDKCIL